MYDCMIIFSVGMFLVILLCIPTTVLAFDVDDLINHANRNSWYTGLNLSTSDSFQYNICDYTNHFKEPCFVLQLDFVANLLSQNKTIWIVQAMTQNTSHIFLIDSESFDIDTIHDGQDTAESIHDTLFYFTQFANKQTPKQLRIGEIWGTIPTSINLRSDLVIVSQDSFGENDHTLDVFLLEYGLFESSIFMISREMPFPVAAVIYDPYSISSSPPMIFSFELLDFSIHEMK